MAKKKERGIRFEDVNFIPVLKLSFPVWTIK